jgi:hypothetical protein
MRFSYLICYDICDDKRLRQVFQTMRVFWRGRLRNTRCLRRGSRVRAAGRGGLSGERSRMGKGLERRGLGAERIVRE